MPYSSETRSQSGTNNENRGRQVVQVSPYRRRQNGHPVDVSGYTRLSPVASSRWSNSGLSSYPVKKDMGSRLDITERLRRKPIFKDKNRNYRLDQAYVNGLIDARSPWLEFDGMFLRLYEGEDLVQTWPAVAGDQDHRSDLFLPTISNQEKPNQGPLPEGLYVAQKKDYQEIGNLSFWERAANFIPESGQWRGGVASWGEQRVWLTPNSGNTMYGRGGFTIHGGDTPGSAGCIDLTGAMDDFAKRYKGYDQDILVVVRYP